jgi:hypothetical protein
MTSEHSDGAGDGASDGDGVGFALGEAEGDSLGVALGAGVGIMVGEQIGGEPSGDGLNMGLSLRHSKAQHSGHPISGGVGRTSQSALSILGSVQSGGRVGSLSGKKQVS